MILTLTLSPVLDKSASIDSLKPAQKLRCSGVTVHPGGGGINVSRALHELGCKACALFPYGGAAGDLLVQQLQQSGVPFRALPSAAPTRESFNVTDLERSAQYRFVQPAAAVERPVLEQLLLWEDFTDARFLVISGGLPPNLPAGYLGRVVQQAKRMGMRVVADSSGAGLEELLAAGVFLLKPSLAELAALSGRGVLADAEAPRVAQEQLQKHRTGAMVVSLGAAGAVLVTKDNVRPIAALPVEAKSTVGAGDSLVAGIVWMLDRGAALAEAVRFGVACGTAATLAEGTALFRREDAWHAYRTMTAPSIQKGQ